MFVLDLFSGAGGLAEGFFTEGFDSIAHIEMDKDAINTLETRLTYHYLKKNNRLSTYVNYLEKSISREELYQETPQALKDTIINQMLSENTFDSICRLIDANATQMGCTDIDVLIGGPPCQTYSIISRNTKNYQNTDDQRNHLYKLYAQLLGRYKPKFFVFENVPGLKTISKGEIFKKLITLIEEQGYKVVPFELDARDFGVLQRRNRLIVAGWRREYPILDFSFPKIQFAEAIVGDLFEDLVSLVPGEEKNIYSNEPTVYLQSSKIRNDSSIPLTQHMCRVHNNKDREIYRTAIELWNNSEKRLDYSKLPDTLITRTKPEIFTDKYKVVAGNLPFSHTVIAHIAKDGHYYIHPDIRQSRSISVREAARIQSFPDDYYFEGNRQKVFTQIGNAVPPLMAKQLAHGIKEALTLCR